ncbi:heptahelical transmembrane protein 1-like [Macadamia integrifolia]|uniref:heptahelical transmembrane protein 1-like n=1 Tax=Macadamia integrifolia TaxID=60698 RepID=UPI001C4EDAB8|nr:heptahelical transmembrane protein 1-like [Macadamia integrifolia]
MVMETEMKTHHHLPDSLDDTTAENIKTTVVIVKTRTTMKKRSETKRKKKYNLVSFWESPDYLRDNEYILNYYRVDWPLKESFFSIFSWHNETLNVWTHLLGFLLFLVLTIVNSRPLPQLADFLCKLNRSYPINTAAISNSSDSKNFLPGVTTLSDFENLTVARWPFFVFLGGSMFCLLSSSICHLFLCHSQRLNLLLLRLDYIGITVMIITSFFPPIYYTFQCDSQWLFFYLTGITVLGILTVVTLLSPVLITGPFRPLRALLFSSMVLFGIFPAAHALVLHWNEPRHFIALVYEAAMALFYGIGTLFYVTRIPERWKPGMFDIVGQSHQMFHVFVIMGALAHYGAALLFIQWRNILGCD